jgi:hypothetical protein
MEYDPAYWLSYISKEILKVNSEENLSNNLIWED